MTLERSSFLREAQALLDSSLDYDQTLVRVAELCVPRFADTCFIDVLEADGSLRRVDSVVNDQQARERLRVWAIKYPTRAGEPIAEVIRTGEPVFTPLVPDAVLLPLAQSEEHREVLLKRGPRSAMAIPLTARGRVLGVLSFIRSRWAPGEPYTEAEFEQAKQFTQVAALAVDNARLYQEQKRRWQSAVEEVKRLTDSLLHSLEEDRRRIARDLHDGMGQRL
ncbi:MAG: GAF domain-containing protein, partial [Myxococcaceae bacterium]